MLVSSSHPNGQLFKPLRVTFVTKELYSRLQSVHFSMPDFVGLVHHRQHTDCMSVMTQGYLYKLNCLLHENLLNTFLGLNSPPLSDKENVYLNQAVMADMVAPSTAEISNSGQGVQICYDTISVDDSNLLVIVENGFLNHLADNKDNYRQFVLACVRCMDRFKCDVSQLNQVYLQLQLNGGPYELLRCRIQ